MYENLVIEGGGARIAAIGGTLLVLEKKGVLQKIKRYAGTSSGAITTAGLAVGFTGKEISKLLLNTDFSKFKDDDTGFLRDTYRFMGQWGLYKGNYFYNWISELIAEKTGDRLYTFRQLYNDTGKELVLVTTNLNEDRPYYMSRYTQPDMPIAMAVRMSMSVPFGFVPIKFKGCYYVDGGVSDNYPLHIFDGHYPWQMRTLFKEANSKTLGLKLMGKEEHRDGMIHHVRNDINNIVDFSTALLTHMMNRIERMSISPEYWKRTITVPTGEIGMMEFDLSRERKVEAQKNAAAIASKQLEELSKPDAPIQSRL